MYNITNPETVASDLIQSIWAEKSFPIDPVQIARELGIDIVEANLPENVSGALIKDVGKDPIILLSKSDSKNRKRFSCAHELGHYAYRSTNNGDHYEYIDFRDQLSSIGSNPEEIYANQFAASLLMPSNEVRRLNEKKTPSILMAQYFGVSDDAMRFRLKNLGLSS